MTDPKEFESLDELFRKTFDQLPPTPAQSGWDQPSEKVWQHVQSHIKPPRAGWSNQTLVLVAAFAVTVAVGVYLFLSRPDVPDATATPPAVEAAPEKPASPESVAPAAMEPPTAETEPADAEPAPPKPAYKREKARKETAASPGGQPTGDIPSEITEKPPVKRTISPNTTERRKAELEKRAREAWEKPLPALPQRWPGKDLE